MLRFLFLFLLVACPIAVVCAQDAPLLQHRLTLSVGGYRFNDVGYTPAPSVEFATDLFHLKPALLTFGAVLAWSRVGYGVDDEGPTCNDCPTGRDYTGHGFGGHLYVELTEAPAPIRFSFGLLHHIGRVEYRTTGGENANAGPGNQTDYTSRATLAQLGLGIAWPLSHRLEVATDARVYSPPLGEHLSSGPQISMTVGVGVRL